MPDASFLEFVFPFLLHSEDTRLQLVTEIEYFLVEIYDFSVKAFLALLAEHLWGYTIDISLDLVRGEADWVELGFGFRFRSVVVSLVGDWSLYSDSLSLCFPCMADCLGDLVFG